MADPTTVWMDGASYTFPPGMTEDEIKVALHRHIVDSQAPTPAAPPKPAATSPFNGAKAGASVASQARQSTRFDAIGDIGNAVADYAPSVIKGAARAVGVPTSVDEAKQFVKHSTVGVLMPAVGTANDAVEMIRGAIGAGERAAVAPTTGRALQEAAKGVPFVGGAAAQLADPSMAYSEGRAPTVTENQGAVEGGATLATMAAAVSKQLSPAESHAGAASIASSTTPEIEAHIANGNAVYTDPHGRSIPINMDEVRRLDNVEEPIRNTNVPASDAAGGEPAADRVPSQGSVPLAQEQLRPGAGKAGRQNSTDGRPSPASEVAHTPEELALADAAGAGQEAARTAEPAFSRKVDNAVDGMVAKQTPVPSDLRQQLFDIDAKVKATEDAHLAAVQEADARMKQVEVTPFGKRPRNAVVVEGEHVDFMTQAQADALRKSMTDPTLAAVTEARKAKQAFYDSLAAPADRGPGELPQPDSANSAPPTDTSLMDARVDATKNVYRKFVSRLDEMDEEPGTPYPVERFFHADSDPATLAKGRRIYDGFADWRAAAKERYGDTMPLVRYGSERPERALTHWSDPADADAASHAMEGDRPRTLIQRDVPIDDIVAAPHNGPGRQNEYLVLNRNSPSAVDFSGGDGPPTMHTDASTPTPTPSAILGAAKRASASVKEIAEGIAPASASPEAQAAADIVRGSKATIDNQSTVERYQNRAVTKAFMRASDADNIANISHYERTGTFANEPTPGYSEKFRSDMDEAHKTLTETYGADRTGYVENYVRRAFKFGGLTKSAQEANAAKATTFLKNYTDSLSASQSPLKARVLDMPLGDALAQMKARGIDVKMATTNPEVIRQWSVENANQAKVYKQAWIDAKDANLIQFVKQGGRTPDGMVPLDDRAAQVFYPAEGGLVRGGQYYADPTVARIFNNTISKGLGGSPTFRGIRNINNAYNQMQLGFSGFHLTGTAINAAVSDLGLGIQQLIQGDVAGGVKSIGRAAVPGYSFAKYLNTGRQIVNGLVDGDPAAQQFLTEKLNPAGGRLAIEKSYMNSAYDNMTRAWSNNQFIRAGLNVPMAIAQKAAAPLMEYAIPRVKIGAFKALAEAELQRLGPDASPAEVQRAYGRAWDSIDNRFGQLVHDNLFWNRTAADLAQVSTRSVGWNLGTIRELGGGVSDALHGQLTPRVYYSAALPIVAGTIGAIFQYLHTGKGPSETKDYFYPLNGLKDSKGRPDRSSLPTYMKDVYSYGTFDYLHAASAAVHGHGAEAMNDAWNGAEKTKQTIEHKASPLLSLTVDLGSNHDYFGDMIRNDAGPAKQQLKQIGMYALGQFRPLALQQAQQSVKEGAPLRRIAEPFLGFTNASAEMKDTDQQNAAWMETRRQINDAQMAKEARRRGK